jgi:hypothetical protein
MSYVSNAMNTLNFSSLHREAVKIKKASKPYNSVQNIFFPYPI